MISKKTISGIKSLHQLKQRREQKLFIAEGSKVVAELLQSDLKVKMIACLPEFEAVNRQQIGDSEVLIVSEKELSAISMLQTPNQVVAVAEIPENTLPSFNGKNNMLVLDGIRDPGNMGTIIRTAEWFSLQQVICSPDCVDIYNPKVVQGAMGSLFRMNICYESLEIQIQRAREGGYFILGASADGISYREAKVQRPWLLVIGSESHGISPQLLSLVDLKAAIPRPPGVKTESLNAAVAAAVLLSVLPANN